MKDSSGGKKGQPNAICTRCCGQHAAARKECSAKRKAEDTGSRDGGKKKKPATGGMGGEIANLGNMEAEDFLAMLKGLDTPLKVLTRVNAKDIALIGPEVSVLERADIFAKAVGRVQLLHWRCGN